MLLGFRSYVPGGGVGPGPFVWGPGDFLVWGSGNKLTWG
jgi:hypothetical protein